MIRVLSFPTFLLFIVFLLSCKKSSITEENTVPTSKTIIGTWKVTRITDFETLPNGGILTEGDMPLDELRFSFEFKTDSTATEFIYIKPTGNFEYTYHYQMNDKLIVLTHDTVVRYLDILDFTSDKLRLFEIHSVEPNGIAFCSRYEMQKE